MEDLLIDLEKLGIDEEEALEVKQRDEQWHKDRIGKFTGSEIYRLMAEAKRPMTAEEFEEYKKANPKGTAKTIADPTLLSDGAMTYILEVAGEILTGMSADSEVKNIAMEWGIYNEPAAARLYEKVKNVKCDEVGSLKFSDYASVSPDRLVKATNGGIEIKCPFSNHKHLENLMLSSWQELKETHKDYYWQCIKGMLVSKSDWWDFVSYSPNFEGSAKIGIVHIPFGEVQEDVRLLAIKLKVATAKVIEIVDKFKEEEIFS